MSIIEELNPGIKGLGTYEYGWSDSDAAGVSARRGLNEEVVRDISGRKSEPQWMLDLRLKGLKLFGKKPMPTWGSDLTGIDFQNIKYFVKSTEKQATSWEELPEDIRNTYDRLGIPEADIFECVARVSDHATLAHLQRLDFDVRSAPRPAEHVSADGVLRDDLLAFDGSFHRGDLIAQASGLLELFFRRRRLHPPAKLVDEFARPTAQEQLGTAR